MFRSELERKRDELSYLIQKLDDTLTNRPEGRLRIMMDGKSPKFFWIKKPGDTVGCYIKKENMDTAKQLANFDYAEKMLQEAKKEKKLLESFLASYDEGKLGQIYDKMHAERKKMVSALVLSDDEYAKRWLNEPYETNPYYSEELIHETNRGEFVRSKSEKMIANIYNSLGVPYKYEYPIQMRDGSVKYPDFTILDVKNRREIYHEHLGMLEESEYRKNTLIKIRTYEKNGIYLGSNLLITYETPYCPFDDKQLRRMITDLFVQPLF